jgi:OOP family OmpA-OmpF porin
MKFTKASSILSCAVLAVMASSATFADDSGWYVGGNVGQSKARLDEQKIINDVVPTPIPHAFLSDDTTGRGYKLYGGYQINEYLSLEGGYFDLGKFQFNNTIAPNGLLESDMKVRGVNMDVVGYLPFTEKLSAFGRLGVTYALTQDTFTTTNAPSVRPGKLSQRDTLPKAGVGLEYKFNDALAMRVEAERYRISNALTDHNDIDLYSVGLVYRFGSKPAPQPVVVTPPPAPMPAPVVAPAPAPKFEKYTMSATELFTFDSASVNAAQPKLQEITDAIKGPGAPDKIVITGYTDRLGSEAYNQKLSERRAQAVKDYMVTKGVAADRLVAEGKGEADPIVQCDDKNKAALIKCLAPNRRVEVDQVKIVREVTPN